MLILRQLPGLPDVAIAGETRLDFCKKGDRSGIVTEAVVAASNRHEGIVGQGPRRRGVGDGLVIADGQPPIAELVLINLTYGIGEDLRIAREAKSLIWPCPCRSRNVRIRHGVHVHLAIGYGTSEVGGLLAEVDEAGSSLRTQEGIGRPALGEHRLIAKVGLGGMASCFKGCSHSEIEKKGLFFVESCAVHLAITLERVGGFLAEEEGITGFGECLLP